MSTTIPTQIEKCRGAMLATAIGDALGWPNEPRSRNRVKKPKVSDFFVEWTRSCSDPRWHDERIISGEYSDDTQMTLSVARSLIAGDWEKFFAEKELPFWLQYERGGGSAMRKAALSIKEKKTPLWLSSYSRDYFNAGGNGAAMRILPHIIAGANKTNLPELMLDIIKNTLITHGHPRAFLGATCYAFALDYLLRKDTVLEYGELVSAVINGQEYWGAFPNLNVFGHWLDLANQYAGFDYAQEWEKDRSRMLSHLQLIKDSLKRGLMLDDTKIMSELECFGRANGAGDVAALTAVYLTSRYAANPVLGVKVPAYSFNADTDTIASITGGLLGMLCGVDWIPTEWKFVQDYNCLVQIADILLSDDKKLTTKTDVLNADGQEYKWKLSPIGKMRFVDAREFTNGKNGVVVVNKWQTALGQTLYMKDFRSIDAVSPQWSQNNGQTTLDKRQQSAIAEQKLQQSDTTKAFSAERDDQKTISKEVCERQFMLTAENIKVLLERPEFKGNITIGKALKIIAWIIETGDSAFNVSKRFDLDEGMVRLLQMYIK